MTLSLLSLSTTNCLSACDLSGFSSSTETFYQFFQRHPGTIAPSGANLGNWAKNFAKTVRARSRQNSDGTFGQFNKPTGPQKYFLIYDAWPKIGCNPNAKTERLGTFLPRTLAYFYLSAHGICMDLEDCPGMATIVRAKEGNWRAGLRNQNWSPATPRFRRVRFAAWFGQPGVPLRPRQPPVSLHRSSILAAESGANPPQSAPHS